MAALPDDPHLEAGVRSARLPCLGERPNCPLRPMPRKRALRCVHRVYPTLSNTCQEGRATPQSTGYYE
jgi:hypothetical protein